MTVSIKLLGHLLLLLMNIKNHDGATLFKMSVAVIHWKLILCNYFLLVLKNRLQLKNR